MKVQIVHWEIGYTSAKVYLKLPDATLIMVGLPTHEKLTLEALQKATQIFLSQRKVVMDRMSLLRELLYQEIDIPEEETLPEVQEAVREAREGRAKDAMET